MKRIITAAVVFATMISATAQQTITSVTNGNATNPFTWDCTCFPSTSDHVIIAHDVVMNTDWLINGGGSVTVNAGATFVEDVQNRSILVDGTGSMFTNNGTTELTGMAFTNGAGGGNSSSFVLDSALYLDASSSFDNTGAITSLDSLLNSGTYTNSSSGSLGLGDLWNDGSFTNNGSITADSLLNTDSFTSTGIMSCYDFANSGTFGQTANFNVANNFYNAGDITIGASSTVLVGNDMASGDTLGGSASLTNDGSVGIGNDFLNTDVLDGSGRFCITNASTNTGNVSGTLDVCDQTPGAGFDVNLGSIGASVTFCSTPCDVGIAEINSINVLLYPNPASTEITVELENSSAINSLLTITDISGKIVTVQQINGAINNVEIGDLTPGIYLCKITQENQSISVQRLVIE